MIAPNIAAPTANEATVAAENVRSSKSSSGRIGSSARRSQRTNPVASTVAATNRPTMTGEVHVYSVPPQTAARRPAAAPVVSRTAPT
jgi:hypothetical protein